MSTSRAAGPLGDYRQLLKNRAYARVFAAGLGSVIGSSISGVCLVWLVYTSTDSALDVALLGTSWIVGGILFSVFGGTWVDRYDRRRLMVLADLSRAAALAVVVLDLELRGFELVPILGAYFVIGSFTTIFNPAEQAIVPSLVEPHLVADANGLVRSSRATLQFVGAALAGVLIVTVGTVVGVGANAVTFLVSGLLLLGMRVPARDGAASPGAPRAYFTEVAAGFRWLWRAKGFFQLTISAMAFNFCSAIVGSFIVVFAKGLLHGSAVVFSALLAAEVAGSAIGALLVGRTRAVRWAGRAWVVPYGVVSALVVLALVLVPVVPVAITALFALGLLGGFAGTAWLTAAQLLVPTDMQGRYFGIDSLGSIAILPAAQIGGALLIVAYGIRETYLLAGLVWLVAGAAFLLPRALWNLGYRPPPVTLRSDAAAPGTSGSPEGTLGG
ncbi:MAG: MFS transporter [Thermoplasmata archaeon]